MEEKIKMQCKKCGCKLSEEARFCPECGNIAEVTETKNEVQIKFCSECGRPLDEKTGECNYCREQEREESENRGNNTVLSKKKNGCFIFFIGGLGLSIVFIALGIGLLFINFLKEDTSQERILVENQNEKKNTITKEQEKSKTATVTENETTVGDTNVTENKTDAEATSMTNDKITKEQEMKTTTQEIEKEFTLKGVEIGNNPDYNICTNPDTYQRVEIANGEFSFGYPEGFFNHVEKDGEDYIFMSEEGKATLIVRQKKGSGDAILDVQNAYSFLNGKIDTSNKETGIKLVSERIKEGWAHCIYGGTYFDDTNKAAYFIGVSNGKNVYTMDFEYYEPDTNNYHTPQNYMIDCLYRLCEHSGTSYRVRTYEQFLADDMGKKK